MGIFHEQVELVNRTSKVLHLRFDGQDVELQPNYDVDGALLPDVHNMVPTITAPYAKSQNVLMGSEDPFDPSEYIVLVGVKVKKGQKQKDDISYCEQSNELTRVKLADYLGDDPTIKEIKVGRMPRARRGEAAPLGDKTPFDLRVK